MIRSKSKAIRIILKANNVQKIHYLAHVDELQVKTIQGVSVIFLQQMPNLVDVKISLLSYLQNTWRRPTESELS